MGQFCLSFHSVLIKFTNLGPVFTFFLAFVFHTVCSIYVEPISTHSAEFSWRTHSWEWTFCLQAHIRRSRVMVLVGLLIAENPIPAHCDPHIRSVASQPFSRALKPQTHGVGETVWLQRSTEEFWIMIELFHISIVVVVALLHACIKTHYIVHLKLM